MPYGTHGGWSGGHALNEGLIVVTKNVRGYRRLQGFRSKNERPAASGQAV